MTKFQVHMEGLPPVDVHEDSISGLESLKRLNVRGLDRIVALKANGQLRDLTSPVDSDAQIQPIYVDSIEGLEILRHSTSHVMAMAVKELYPGVKVAIGPAIENGFYYDFDFERAFKEEDLAAIKEKMEEIVKADLPFLRRDVKKEEALELFGKAGEEYKVELIEGIDAEKVSLYTQDRK
ncbi:MAG: threonine--tRNA ligase, partial [Desulfobacterales bacterium]|nr:threonine--tRNA ligase [Desulfobacterales bacterium]